MFEEILYEEHGDVAVLTLNRPEARNALTFKTYEELERAVRDVRSRCLVITGTDAAFCSGDDVKQVGSARRVSSLRSARRRAGRSRPRGAAPPG